MFSPSIMPLAAVVVPKTPTRRLDDAHPIIVLMPTYHDKIPYLRLGNVGKNRAEGMLPQGRYCIYTELY